MPIVVAGLGRCGTNQLCRLISIASQKPYRFEATALGISTNPASILKTHTHYSELLAGFPAIFLYSNVLNIYASLYAIYKDPDFFARFNREMGIEISGSNIPKEYWREFLDTHFLNLGVHPHHIRRFWKIATLSKDLAFLFLVFGDKLRLKENYSSWKKSNSVLFLNFKDLIQKKTSARTKLSHHLGFPLPDFGVHPRQSHFRQLPMLLRVVIRFNYARFEAGELLKP